VATRASTASADLRPGGIDPLRWAWQLLTNVKFALLLVGLAGVAGFAGVAIPQVPLPMRENPVARAAWIELQKESFGPFTQPMDRFQLFDIFHAWWFYGLWLLIIVAVTVCTVSRIRPTVRGVRKAPKVVGDRYFEAAHHRAEFSHPGGAAAIEQALRQRRYAVERVREADGTTWLFAQRFQWAAYGTFLSHLALLMILVGGLLTQFGGFDRTMVIAETTPPAPVFEMPGPGQMFVRMVDSHRGMDGAGNIIDYHSRLEVSKGGETVTCKTTVNDPCRVFGYTIHQAAFFDDLARFRITAPGGELAWEGVLDFENKTTTVPRLRFEDQAGVTVFDAPLPQMATEPGTSPGREDDVAIALLSTSPREGAPAEEHREYAFSWRMVGKEFRLVASGGDLPPRELRPGDRVPVANGVITYVGPSEIPALEVEDMPGTPDGRAVVQMPIDTGGEPYLFVTGLAAANVRIGEGAPYTNEAGYTYAYEGRVEASGVSVKRDPGDTFIWLAVGMAMVGLAITFYVPRRRLWVKVTPTRTYLAGLAERTTRFGRELRRMGAELGSRDALIAEDEER
jgi:cytochrome c biogenesis protein ResB